MAVAQTFLPYGTSATETGGDDKKIEKNRPLPSTPSHLRPEVYCSSYMARKEYVKSIRQLFAGT